MLPERALRHDDECEADCSALVCNPYTEATP